MNVMEPEALAGYVQWGFRDRPDGQVELSCPPEVEAWFFECGTRPDGAPASFDHLASLHAGVAIVCADGTDLPPEVLRRLACDAEIIPAVLDGRGEVLDLGRLRRPVTTALWTALVLRDRHCTFPACRRPPLMCHAHHLVHWADGGPTSLDNLALLCGHHHRVIHHTPWEIRLNHTDRQPEFLPPPTLGNDPEWVRYRPRRE